MDQQPPAFRPMLVSDAALEGSRHGACNRQMTQPIRRFRAHAMAEDAHSPSATIDAHSFEEAAVTFMEMLHDGADECRVTVRDNQTGEQHCFSLRHDGELSEGC